MTACRVTQSRQPAAQSVSNTAETTSLAPRESSIVQESIRRIDFGNFVYDWYPAWADAPSKGRKIILKDGVMLLDFDYGREPREFSLIDNGVSYGDLTGDRSEEAVVVLNIITSGTARPFLVFVYTISDGQPKRLWAYETGDRWQYGYHKVSIQNGQLIVERYKPKIIEYQGQKHDMSSSDTYIRGYYHWNGKEFTEIKIEELPVDAADKNPWVHVTNP